MSSNFEILEQNRVEQYVSEQSLLYKGESVSVDDHIKSELKAEKVPDSVRDKPILSLVLPASDTALYPPLSN